MSLLLSVAAIKGNDVDVNAPLFTDDKIVLGYFVGTIGAIACAELMRMVAPV